MTTNTRDRRVIGLHRFHIMHDIVMTFTACAFGDTAATILDLNRFVKVASGKSERMKKSVFRLGEVLWNEAGRRVTIIAGGNGTMTRLCPAIEMVLHNMTIDASLRIVAEIRSTFGIDESVAANACNCPQRQSYRNRKESRRAVWGGD